MKTFSIASPHKSELWYDYRLYINLIAAIESLGYKYRKNSRNRIYFLGAPRRKFYPDVGKFDPDANNLALMYCHFELVDSFNEFRKVFVPSESVVSYIAAKRKSQARFLRKNEYLDSMKKLEILRPFSSLIPKPIESEKFKCDLSFIGSPRIRPIVEDIIPIVEKYNYSFQIIGPHWDQYKGNSRARDYVVCPTVEYKDFPMIAHNAKICLVDHHPSMNKIGSVSHKYVDLVNSGAFVISDNNIDAKEFYDGVLYDSPDKLEKIINLYLDDAGVRERKREAQYRFVSHQTSLNAATQLVKWFE